MSQVQLDPLLSALQEFQCALAAESCDRDLLWAEDVHAMLGRLADAVQVEIRAAERDVKLVGDVNPDLQNAPAVERHAETIRVRLISLGENIHQLRAQIRVACEQEGVSANYFRLRGTEIRSAVEKVRQADGDFLQMAINADLGSGE